MARYRIVPDQSQVWIDASSSVHPIHSHTEGLTGEVELTFGADGALDLGAPVGGGLSLSTDRLRSGNPLQDRELRRRIEATRFPTIDGELVAIAAGDEDGHYEVEGDVSFKGVANRYVGDMAIARREDGSVSLQGAASFDVRDFGMDPPKILVLQVHPVVSIRVDVLAVPL